MSEMTDLPEAVRNYLDSLSYELRFERKYAAEICDEIGNHFYDALACSTAPDSDNTARQLTREFGSPQFLAADFAAILMTRKLRNSLFIDLSIMVAIGLAVINCLSASKEGLAVLFACISGAVTWGALLWIQIKGLNGSKLYHWLCTPMIASHITSLFLALALLRDCCFTVHTSIIYASFEVAATFVLAGRFLYIRKRSKIMCQLWQKVATND